MTVAVDHRPITFFMHHQGRGHAQRTMAIVRELPPERRVTVLTAQPSLFDGCARPIAFVELPDVSDWARAKTCYTAGLCTTGARARSNDHRAALRSPRAA